MTVIQMGSNFGILNKKIPENLLIMPIYIQRNTRYYIFTNETNTIFREKGGLHKYDNPKFW